VSTPSGEPNEPQPPASHGEVASPSLCVPDRPKAKNPADAPLMAALRRVWAELAADPAERAVGIMSNWPVFSVGFRSAIRLPTMPFEPNSCDNWLILAEPSGNSLERSSRSRRAAPQLGLINGLVPLAGRRQQCSRSGPCQTSTR